MIAFLDEKLWLSKVSRLTCSVAGRSTRLRNHVQRYVRVVTRSSLPCNIVIVDAGTARWAHYNKRHMCKTICLEQECRVGAPGGKDPRITRVIK